LRRQVFQELSPRSKKRPLNRRLLTASLAAFPAECPEASSAASLAVRAPRVLYQPAPRYPVLARETHLSGDVVIDAILDWSGNVTDMRIVSGPVLLYEAALTALSQWKCEPTYLNDQPVAVQMIVVVRFRLDQQ
jgi:TonB family protein